MINTTSQDRSFINNWRNDYFRNDAATRDSRSKYSKNSDKKILQAIRKLSPPCKDNSFLQDRIDCVRFLKDDTNNTIPK